MSSLSLIDKISSQVLDTFLGYRIRYSTVPGYQVSIRKKGNLIFSKAYGYANQIKKEKYTKAHLGRIASQSKIFTAALVFILQEQGKLNIHDKIVDYLPELKKHKDKRFKKITIRDLMTHRSGIFRDGIDSCFWDSEKPFPKESDLIKEALQENLVFDTNTVTKYSNFGFSLLGIVIERAANDRYENLIRKHIISKLSAKNIHTDYTKKEKFAQGHSKPFYEGKRKTVPHTSSHSYMPAAGFCSTTENTTGFLYELYFTDKILPENIRKDMLYLNWAVKNTKSEFYGFGTMSDHENSNAYVGHSGGYPGFVSQTRHVLDTDYTYGLIMNANEYVSFALIRSMHEVHKKIKSYFSPEELKNIVISEPMMSKWGAAVYLVGKNKALSFDLSNWLLTQGVGEYTKRDDGLFYCEKFSGYLSLGEPLKVTYSGKKIKFVKIGSFSYYEEKEFLRRSQKDYKI